MKSKRKPKLKKYRVYIEYFNEDEIDVYAKNKKEAEQKAYDELYIDCQIESVDVEEINEEEE